MAIVSLTFRGNEPFYLGGCRKIDGVYVFETEVVDGRSMTLKAWNQKQLIKLGSYKWHWSAEERVILHRGAETTLAQAKISALLTARRVLIGKESTVAPSLRGQLTQRQRDLMTGMLPQQALAVACTQLLTEQPELEAEIEAVYAELVAEVEDGLARRELEFRRWLP